MATDPTAPAVTFSSPTMRARSALLRGLQAVDELERAWTRRDYWTARLQARTAQDWLQVARDAYQEAEGLTDTLEGAEPPAASHGATCGWDGRAGSCTTPMACAALPRGLVALAADTSPDDPTISPAMAQYQADGR